MIELNDLPNIGKILAGKLKSVGIVNCNELKAVGSENAIIRIATLENHGVCINMLYALEGAIQRVRWHNLETSRKQELKVFFLSMNKSLKKR